MFLITVMYVEWHQNCKILAARLTKSRSLRCPSMWNPNWNWAMRILLGSTTGRLPTVTLQTTERSYLWRFPVITLKDSQTLMKRRANYLLWVSSMISPLPEYHANSFSFRVWYIARSPKRDRPGVPGPESQVVRSGLPACVIHPMIVTYTRIGRTIRHSTITTRKGTGHRIQARLVKIPSGVRAPANRIQ